MPTHCHGPGSPPPLLGAGAFIWPRSLPVDPGADRRDGGSPDPQAWVHTRDRTGTNNRRSEDESTEPVVLSGRRITRRRMVSREVCIPTRAARRTPALPEVARPIEVTCWL